MERGPYAKTPARRAQILEAAGQAFAEHGYEAASLRDIAQRAGITHAAVLHHYKNKEALLIGLLAQRDLEEQARAEQQPADPSGQPAPGEFLAGLLREHEANPEFTRMWLALAVTSASADHPAHAYFQDRYSRARAYVLSDFEAAAANGELAPELTPEAAAALVFSVLDGLQIQWLHDPTLDVATVVTQFMTLLRRSTR